MGDRLQEIKEHWHPLAEYPDTLAAWQQAMLDIDWLVADVERLQQIPINAPPTIVWQDGDSPWDCTPESDGGGMKPGRCQYVRVYPSNMTTYTHVREITKRQCTAAPTLDGYCLTHHPDRRAARRAAQKLCMGTSATGKPCGLPVKPGAHYCFHHLQQPPD